jgi:glycosyltransferase involved in cell wall biosynthesis
VLVSVITSVYNGELYLREAINSILSQTYSNLEYIIVNDGSTDGTAEILNSFYDYRLKVIHLDKNQGAASCLNMGIDLASGELIAIQDADDISLTNRLEDQVNFLTNNHEYIGVASYINSIQGFDPVSHERLQGEESSSNRFTSANQIYQSRFHGCPLVHGSVMFYKNIFYKVGKYDPYYKIAYDYDLWLRMFEIGKIGIIQYPLYQWRVNPGSLSRNKAIDTNNEVLRASTTAIIRQYYNGGMNPILGVCGTSNALENFHQNVSISLGLNCMYYSLRTKNYKNIYSDYYKNRIHGLIILDSYSKNSETMYHQLSLRGFDPNNTLFKVWNVIN